MRLTKPSRERVRRELWFTAVIYALWIALMLWNPLGLR